MSLMLCVVSCIDALHVYPFMDITPMARITMRKTSKNTQSLSNGYGVRILGRRLKEEVRDRVVTNASPTYLDLDSGLRISRILTVSTDSFDVMSKLSRATSRPEIMHIALIRHKRKCVLMEYQQLPVVFGAVYNGWSYGHRPGSHMRTNSGTRSSNLWVIDDESFNIFEVEVGSWLLASILAKGDSRMSTLFSRTISRVYTDAQVVNLVRPGVATTKLVHTPDGLQWIITFIELEHCDELGIPKRR